MIKFNHYSVAVDDLDEAVSNYQARFGMEPIGEREHNSIGNFRFQRMGYGGEQLLQIISPEGDDSPIHRLMQGRKSEFNPYGEGIYLVAYTTDDVDGFCEQVQENGGRVNRVEGAPYAWVHPTASNFVLMEIMPAH